MTIPLCASRLHIACAAIAALVLSLCIPKPACVATYGKTSISIVRFIWGHIYLLLATVSGQGWQDGFWYAYPDGLPKPIHVTESITDADIVVG